MKSPLHPFLLFLLIPVLFTSCDEPEAVKAAIPPTISNPGTLLNSCEIEQINLGEGDEVYRFIYGEKNRLENILLGSLTAEGMFEEEDNYDLIYTNERLSSIETTDGYLTYAYEYNDRGLVIAIRETWIHSETLEEKVTVRSWTYDAENRLAEEVRIFNVGEETETGEFSDVFEWEGANVSKVTSFYNPKDDSNGRLIPQKLRVKHFLFRKGARSSEKSLSSEDVLSDFDDKRNPLMYLSFVYSGAIGKLISENNARKGEHTAFLTDGTTIEVRGTSELTYDASGRPRTYTDTEYEEGWSPKTYKIEVTYKN